jgi:hypothetical protein
MANETVRIPDQLRRLNPLVHATRLAADGCRAGEDGRLRVGPQEGVVRLVVSRAQVRRALLVAQAVVLESERRGFRVEATGGRFAPPGVSIVVGAGTYLVEIVELMQKAPMTAADVERWERQHHFRLSLNDPKVPTSKSVPSGRLRVSLPARWDGSRCNWAEGPRGGFENKLPSLFTELERRAVEDQERAAERERLARQRELEAEQRRRALEAVRLEEQRAQRLLEEVTSWKASSDVLEYVQALRRAVDQLSSSDRVKVNAWCDWAEAWARGSDPTAQPALLAGLDEPVES